MDTDFFDGLGLDGLQPAAEGAARPKHRRNGSMDGYSSATSSEMDSNTKKAVADDRLAELALLDPKRAKRSFFFLLKKMVVNLLLWLGLSYCEYLEIGFREWIQNDSIL